MHSELRIAMWSGPRNISTALMRSFENRSDSFVTDEPFYAYFLKESGEDHPGREEIIQSQSSDWETVASELIGSIPQGKTIWYQKHMAHHILDYSNLDWINSVFNCFLIRDPKEVICSYVKRFKLIDHKQLGFNQQLRIFKKIKRKTGETPVVINAKDVLEHPEKILKKLCKILKIEFSKSMLNWPSGKRATDGIWAPYWYSEVEKTTGFQPYSYQNTKLDPNYRIIYDQCMIDYEVLFNQRVKP